MAEDAQHVALILSLDAGVKDGQICHASVAPLVEGVVVDELDTILTLASQDGLVRVVKAVLVVYDVLVGAKHIHLVELGQTLSAVFVIVGVERGFDRGSRVFALLLVLVGAGQRVLVPVNPVVDNDSRSEGGCDGGRRDENDFPGV